MSIVSRNKVSRGQTILLKRMASIEKKKHSKSVEHASFVTILFLVTATRIKVKDKIIK